ncbi:hypothetical protein BU25DRAFT_435148 [Macroventuria anomochaeta]|uniref:Uncharacterized protein n=1 Tax=Macroventuria anomochaeta TaxID=301207 RepID=A0ACB6RLW2_9PLEO|nr:uncharacterized protein BU25DRAFT_435148 [Macroventuria anomochaeta]KAF2621924.1 hypothetical protein BU25DRAFT_435148 [Macroventuria anomochaeta]
MANTNDEQERELAQVQECLDIITYKHNGQKYLNRLGARAKPNQRLAEVFGIKNAFTNENPKNHGDFSKETTKRMKDACKMIFKDDKGDWTDLQERAVEYWKEYMQRAGGHGSINLAELAQFITLKLSLLYLFADAEIASKTKDIFEDIKFIGHRINDLWIESKKPDGERPQWADQCDLHMSLRRVTSATSVDMPGSYTQEISNGAEPTVPEENPLNFLLPAYETMWRVVLRCFIEVHLRDAANKAEWHLVLANFLDKLRNPTCMPDAFHRDSPIGLRPSDIAKESLRLYPPSRHVHRDFNGELHRADIESCHRFKLLGGDDPLVFRPERWLNICPEERAAKVAGLASKAKIKALKNREEKLGFMPFATYCTADKVETRAFAMKMIVMLVAVLCGGLGEEWGLKDIGSLPKHGVPLQSDRTAYGNLVLKRI